MYHENGSAFYENLAQYLAGREPKISPNTARKLLQFSDSKEFEEYLASKLTREEAKRMAIESGENLINVDSLKNDLIDLLDNEKIEKQNQKNFINKNDVYYYFGCEYDPLRQPLTEESLDNTVNETKEYIVNGKKIKSTFISFRDNTRLEKLNNNQLPKKLLNIINEPIEADYKINEN